MAAAVLNIGIVKIVSKLPQSFNKQIINQSQNITEAYVQIITFESSSCLNGCSQEFTLALQYMHT